jgi:hypothetical protein
MSNRLNLAHIAPRRDPEDWLPAPAPRGRVTAALAWLNGLVETDAADLPAAVRRDLGLPELGTPAVSVAYEIERNRVRV